MRGGSHLTDHTLTALFYRSGWTQEELAKKENKSQRWVSYQLCFGRFLNFSTVVLNPEFTLPMLTERQFRSFWDRTNGDERIRFREIINLIKEEAAFRRSNRPKIGKDLVQRYADGKWHTAGAMAKGLSTDEDHIVTTLSTIHRLRGTYEKKNERRKLASSLMRSVISRKRMRSSPSVRPQNQLNRLR